MVGNFCVGVVNTISSAFDLSNHFCTLLAHALEVWSGPGPVFIHETRAGSSLFLGRPGPYFFTAGLGRVGSSHHSFRAGLGLNFLYRFESGRVRFFPGQSKPGPFFFLEVCTSRNFQTWSRPRSDWPVQKSI